MCGAFSFLCIRAEMPLKKEGAEPLPFSMADDAAKAKRHTAPVYRSKYALHF